MERFNFSKALQLAKEGHGVARAGWTGNGMFIYLTKGSYDGEPGDHPDLIDGIPSEFFGYGDHGTTTRLPCLSMRTATGATLNGWLASQSDLLAEDWTVVPAAAD